MRLICTRGCHRLRYESGHHIPVSVMYLINFPKNSDAHPLAVTVPFVTFNETESMILLIFPVRENWSA
jgi:hypothetical protein